MRILLRFGLALAVIFLALGIRAWWSAAPVHADVASQNPLVSSWNVSSIASGAPVLSSDFVPTRGVSVLRIAVVLGSSAPLSIRETDGSATFTSLLNGGSNLTAGCCYTFTWEARCKSAGTDRVTTGPTGFNFVVGSPTAVPILRVTEVSAAVD